MRQFLFAAFGKYYKEELSTNNNISGLRTEMGGKLGLKNLNAKSSLVSGFLITQKHSAKVREEHCPAIHSTPPLAPPPGRAH